MFRFKMTTLYWYCKVNAVRIKDFFIRSTLIAILFGIQWVLGNLVWYAFAFVPLGLPAKFVWFARGYIAFLYSPLAVEKFVYFIVARWIAKRIMKIRKRFNFEPKWQKSYKNITIFA